MKTRAFYTILLIAFAQLSVSCAGTAAAAPPGALPEEGAAAEPGDQAIRALTEHVEHNTVKFELIRTGVRAVQPLLDKFEDENEKIVLAAQITLRWIADAAAQSPHKQASLTRELAKVAKGKRPISQRLFAVQMLGMTRGKKAEKVLISFLGEHELQLTAVESLRRLPGGAVTGGLMVALEKAASVQMRCALLTALGERSDPRVTPLLIKDTKNDDHSVRIAAVKALGECGDPAATTRLMALAKDKGGDETLHQAAVTACMRLGDAYAGRGNSVKAILMYGTALAEAKGEPERVAALERLGHTGNRAVVETLQEWMKAGTGKTKSAACGACLDVADALMTSQKTGEALVLYRRVLDSESSSFFHVTRAMQRCGEAKDADSVSRITAFLSPDAKRFEKSGDLTKLQRDELWYTAAGALGKIASPEATGALADALGRNGSDPLRQLVLLDALAAHRNRQTTKVVALLAANGSGEVQLRAIRALGRIGGEGAEEVLANLLKTKPAESMDAILLAYVDLGDGYMADEDLQRSLGAFQTVIQTGRCEAATVAALQRIAAIGDPSSLKWVTPLLESGEGIVLVEAGEATAAMVDRLAADMERDEAIRLYNVVLKSRAGDRVDVRNRLRNLGEQVDILARNGVVNAWWVIGPFEAKTDEEWGKGFFPESEIALTKQYEVGKRDMRWIPVRTKPNEDFIRLDRLLRHDKDAAAYAYAVIVARREEDVVLQINHDKDGFFCWVNAKRVSTAPRMVEGKPAGPEEATVHLLQGENKILLKTRQLQGNWRLDVRFADAGGEPLKFNVR